LVGVNLDVLVTEGTPQGLAGKRATATTPLVTIGVGDPVGTGLVASLSRPEGNITGSAMFPTVDIVVKGLELLKEIAPGASRVAVVWDPANLALVSVDKQLDAASRPLQSCTASACEPREIFRMPSRRFAVIPPRPYSSIHRPQARWSGLAGLRWRTPCL
jgi:putative ABC transport system substrate-binding protein